MNTKTSTPTEPKTIPVSELVRSKRGFFRISTTEDHLTAVRRGDKTALIVDSDSPIQKGDYCIVFSNTKGVPSFSLVYEATFVCYIKHSQQEDGNGRLLVSIIPRPNITFRKGDLSEEDSLLINGEV